ncbi:glycosyltransferase 87 family protein [Microlunatus parietis]|uniref:Alpha-1,2-mannosyltransferase n=1 Tax=Microlunatus parietis TaxID=682979 RepID=A0A7Y9I495_9ACTN|nr:glycosyltransferase 87 family protein [Microlunatus parietis]NYE69995.1 alpha-1,2-mannosyltransferase [Microlunatus parietis]
MGPSTRRSATPASSATSSGRRRGRWANPFTDPEPGPPLTPRRLLAGFLISLPAILIGLYVGSTTFRGGTLFPWDPVMVDLEVYRLAGRTVLEGGDPYHLPGSLPFLYPPIAALLAVPLALLPLALVEVVWTIGGVLAVLAVLHRFGLSGARLSLVGAATIFVTEPVNQTLSFGQVGIFLVALVVLDLVPGPRILPGRRLLPPGVLTGLAAAVKLTPAIFWLMLLGAGRRGLDPERRAGLVSIASAAALTLAAAAIVPATSLGFWGRLARGDTGLGNSFVYFTNQSVMADAVRVLGIGRGSQLLALAACAVVALLGAWVGLLWHRRGMTGFAVSLCGLAGLLASPVSWSHHFVWVVPIALCLAGPLLPRQVGRVRGLPLWFQVLGWVFVGWVVIAPYKQLPGGADVELTWSPVQNLIASTTALLGLVILITAAFLILRPGERRPSAG